MRIVSAEARNFASYKELAFDFTKKGLCLISGPTGAGKSTFCDLIPWILFGKTAKGGAVDSIRNWNTDSDTYGKAIVEISGDILIIERTRGKSNDLTYEYKDGVSIRGKDLNDTQGLLNNALGLDFDLYLSGAYFHEFSQTAQFFTANAKTRREIIEQLADLRLSVSINTSAIDYKKDLKKEKDLKTNEIEKLRSKKEYLYSSRENYLDKSKEWEVARTQRLLDLEKLSQNFDNEKAKKINDIKRAHLEKRIELQYEIASLEKELLPETYFKEAKEVLDNREFECGDEKCSECGAPKDNSKRLLITKDRYALERQEAANSIKNIQLVKLNHSLQKHLLTLEPLINAENVAENAYSDQIKYLSKENNPHIQTVRSIEEELQGLVARELSLQEELDYYSVELSDVELLQDVIEIFRGELVKNTIMRLETKTNKLFEEFFDSELRVKFESGEADKIEVTIHKDGNEAVYTQLSKGQRQLLKLCFGVSVMETVANHNGLSFNIIFLDEFADGLSEEFKVKTYRLLTQLGTQYENVFCVEHSKELKGLFENRIEVTMVDGESHIESV